MPRALIGAVFAALLLPGCFLCPKVEAIRVRDSRATPQEALDTFRAALQAGTPDILYESFSEEFKVKWDIPGIRGFVAAYNLYRSDFDDLAAVLERAGKPTIRKVTAQGRSYAVVSLAAEEAQGVFVLADVPTWAAIVEVEGYDAQRIENALESPDFSGVLTVEDGTITLGPLDASATGVYEPSEVVGLSISHNWLLHDIKELKNVDALLERLREGGNR